MTYVPGQGPCYRCAFPHAADGLVANCAQAGVLGVLPGVLGTLQATEAIKLITGAGEPLIGRLLTYDALAMSFSEFRVRRRRDCAVCGDSPSITQPMDAKPMADDSPTGIRQLSAAALAELLRAGGRAAPGRRARGRGVRRRPPARARSTSRSASCRSGSARSRRGPRRCSSAAAAGAAWRPASWHCAPRIASPANLEGGLLAWSREVDPTLRVL